MLSSARIWIGVPSHDLALVQWTFPWSGERRHGHDRALHTRMRFTTAVARLCLIQTYLDSLMGQ